LVSFSIGRTKSGCLREKFWGNALIQKRRSNRSLEKNCIIRSSINLSFAKYYYDQIKSDEMAGERSTRNREEEFFKILFGQPEGTRIFAIPRQWLNYII
jgi:hypothetical protein